MLGRDEHDRFVSQIYAAATGDSSWAVALEQAGKLFRSTSTVLNLYDSSGKTFKAEAYGPKTREFAIEYYASELYAKDPRSSYFLAVPHGSIYYDHLLYDAEEMIRNPWCQASCEVLGVTYQLGAMVALPHGVTAAIAILHSEKEGHASQAAIEAFSRLQPHIEQACVLGHIVETGTASRAALLEALTIKADGVILLGRAAAPTFMNDAARAIVSAGDGLAYSMGAFVTSRPPETRRLQQLIRAVLADPAQSGASPGGRVLVSRPSGRRPYVISVTAAPPTERFLSGNSIAAVLHVQDLAAVGIPARESLSSVFGLTDREADLAVELVRHASLSTAAAAAGMAVNTARNHLQAIFQKTGAGNQAEAVQILGRLL